MSLFQLGSFKLHSGGESSFKIDCDALTPNDWECVAQLIANRAGRFRCVYGIPTGGEELAAWLNAWSTNDWRDPFLIVDDVYTTGKSMREAHRWVLDTTNIIGFVVFARQPVQEPWIKALFTMGSG